MAIRPLQQLGNIAERLRCKGNVLIMLFWANQTVGIRILLIQPTISHADNNGGDAATCLA